MGWQGFILGMIDAVAWPCVTLALGVMARQAWRDTYED